MKSITYNEKLDIILSILFEANSTKDSDIVPVQSKVNEIVGLHQNLAVDISLGIQEILLQLLIKKKQIDHKEIGLILKYLEKHDLCRVSSILVGQTTTNNNGDVKKTKVPELAYALTFEGKVLVESGGFEHKNKLERSNILLNRWIAIVVAIGTFGLLILEICRFFIELCKNNCGFQ